MQPDKSFKTSEILQSAETATKVVLGLGLASLTTALLYDFVYWSFIDRRVLTFLVIADHIQTAVYALAFIVMAVCGVLVCTALLAIAARKFQTTLEPISRRWPVAYNWAPEFLAALLSTAVVSYRGGSIINVLIGIVWISVIFRRLFAPDLAMGGRVLAILIAWVAMTYVVAYADVIATEEAAQGNDVVTVNNGNGPLWSYEVRGLLLRLVDRGAILKGTDGRIMFFPKERLVRIDQNYRGHNKPTTDQP